MDENKKPFEPDIPIYVEYGLAAFASAPHLLGNICIFANRVAEELGNFKGEAKISFLRSDALGSLIKIVWTSEQGHIFKLTYVRWPSGDILCPRCRGSKKFTWRNGHEMTCELCEGTGVSGSVQLDDEVY